MYKLEFVILALPTISAAFVKVLNRIGDRVAFWYNNWVILKKMFNNSVFPAETVDICTIFCCPTPLWLTAVRPWWVPSSNQIVRSLGFPPEISQIFKSWNVGHSWSYNARILAAGTFFKFSTTVQNLSFIEETWFSHFM